LSDVGAAPRATRRNGRHLGALHRDLTFNIAAATRTPRSP
jgi:hypothetical protein